MADAALKPKAEARADVNTGRKEEQVKGTKPISKPARKGMNVRDFVLHSGEQAKNVPHVRQQEHKKSHDKPQDSDSSEGEVLSQSADEKDGISEDEIDHSVILESRLRPRKKLSYSGLVETQSDEESYEDEE